MLLPILFQTAFIGRAGEFFMDLFMTWLSIFAAPFKEPEMLWIIIPLYLSWIFTDLFQEKRHTSFGNAISNGVVILWVGIDWIRYIVRQLNATDLLMSTVTIGKIVLSVGTSLYGIMIIVFGIQAKEFIHWYGRIRVTSYLLIMFSPLIYGVIPLSFEYILAIFVFFPVFFFIVTALAKIIPDSKAVLDSSAADSQQDLDLFSNKKKNPDDDFSLEDDLKAFTNEEPQSHQPQQPIQPKQNYVPPRSQPRPPQYRPRQPYPQQPRPMPPRQPQQPRRYTFDEEYPFKILK